MLLGLAWSGALIDDEGKSALIAWLNNSNAEAAAKSQALTQQNEVMAAEIVRLKAAPPAGDRAELLEKNRVLVQRNNELLAGVSRLQEENRSLANPRQNNASYTRDDVLRGMQAAARNTPEYDELITAIAYDVNKISIPAQILVDEANDRSRNNTTTLIVARINLEKNALDPNQNIVGWATNEDFRNGRTFTLLDPEILLFNDGREAIRQAVLSMLANEQCQYSNESIARIDYRIRFSRTNRGDIYLNAAREATVFIFQDIDADGQDLGEPHDFERIGRGKMANPTR